MRALCLTLFLIEKMVNKTNDNRLITLNFIVIFNLLPSLKKVELSSVLTCEMKRVKKLKACYTLVSRLGKMKKDHHLKYPKK